MPIDLLADAAPQGDLSRIAEVAIRMQQAEADVEQLELDLKRAKEVLRRIEMEELPELMTQIGVADFKLDNGAKVEVKDIIAASIPSKSAIEDADEEQRGILEARRMECFRFLRKNKADSIIKSVLTINVGKGNAKAVAELIKLAKTFRLPCERDETVHPQTLSKYIRELLEKGAEVPFDTFAVFTGKKAKITAPKERKVK